MVGLFGRMEAHKVARFVEVASASVQAGQGWTQEVGLLLMRAIFDYADNFNYKPVAALLNKADSPGREDAISDFATDFKRGLLRVVPDKLAELKIDPAARKRFLDSFSLEQRTRDATEDLADEHWEVRLVMPGQIIAHNADREELVGATRTLIWEFKALAIMDRDQPILATSYLPAPSR